MMQHSQTAEPAPRVAREKYPSDWKLVKLGDVIDIQGGSQPPKEVFVYEPRAGYVRLLQIRDFGEQEVPTYVPRNKVTKFCTKDDIFVARYGASLGRILTGMEGAYNVALAKVIFDRTAIDHRYMFYLLQTPYFQTPIHMISRSAQNGFNKGEIYPIEVPLAPYQQQKRIVAEIEKQFSRLDEAVASLKRTKANLKRYKAAVLKAAVEGKLVPIKDRQTTKIGEVADLVTKGSSPKWQGFNYTDKGVVFVRSQNVGWGNLDLSDVAHLSPAFNEKERKSVLKTGDVLLNIVGASIGRAALATPDIEGGNVNQAVAVIRLNQERMLPKYLMINLLSPGTQAAIHAEKVDVARANVSLSDIKGFAVLFPSLVEQDAIVAEVERRLSVIDELEATIGANLIRAERLRQSILGSAFSGQLFPQERN